MLDVTAYIRAYTEKPENQTLSEKWSPPKREEEPRYQLIFDCETTTDPRQRLRFGVFQVRDQGQLISEGVCYDAQALSRSEIGLLKAYADRHALNCGTIEEFRETVFLKIGYEAGASIIGFNLPFDISRVAIKASPARKSMAGGFTFAMSDDSFAPNVRVKHLSARAALFDFAIGEGNNTPRGMRKRGLNVDPHRGTFVDVKTLAAALTSRSHSLASLSEALGVETQKQATDEHGGQLTEAYIDYARGDVQSTWECYDALCEQYNSYGLSPPVDRILSEASIGKATLSEMRVQPLLSCAPDHPREDFGFIMASYYGGRAEIRQRKMMSEVILTDFKSMYPTVNALMGLWRFLIADGYTSRESTEDSQALLDRITLADLQRPDAWTQLATLCEVVADDDVLPLRTKYSEDKDSLTIGLNRVTSSKPLVYTLADLIASKLLSGKAPTIKRAVTYSPEPLQSGLKPIDLFGRSDCRIDPIEDDPFRKLIDLRDEAKARKDPIQQQLKIVANSTCYGILVEVNRDDTPKPEPISVWGSDGGRQDTSHTAIEQPGKYFHPLLAALITGAARLMLSTAEALASERGIGWAFCDTDSMAFARPDGMSRNVFRVKVGEIVGWFEGLNPYAKPGSILKIEDVNFSRPQNGELEPLYCHAVSAKRYALYNIEEDGTPYLRKASAHGLGHLRAPYNETLPSECFGLPDNLSQLGVPLWQHDVWQAVIRAALAGHPNQVRYDYHPALQAPAVQRYGATSPALLRWMKHYNEGKPYDEQVKPFGFLVSFMARTGAFQRFCEDRIITELKRGRPVKTATPKPIAPFDGDACKAASKCFNRETGEPVSIEELKTYAEALALFSNDFDWFGNNQTPKMFIWFGRRWRRFCFAFDDATELFLTTQHTFAFQNSIHFSS